MRQHPFLALQERFSRCSFIVHVLSDPLYYYIPQQGNKCESAEKHVGGSQCYTDVILGYHAQCPGEQGGHLYIPPNIIYGYINISVIVPSLF